MCRVLEVSPSAYYEWRTGKPTATQRRTERFDSETRRVFEENHGTTGYRKVYQHLIREEIPCSPETVRKSLKKQGLRAQTASKFVPRTTDSDHDFPVAENVLNRDFQASRPNEKWTSDITYIRTDEGWLYLVVIMDLFSRKIVGWSMADHMRTGLVLDALDMAIAHRRPTDRLIFHSDRGSQYASDAFRGRLNFLNITQSMSRKGNCWDNAPAESFFGKLKTEWVNRYCYATRTEAMRSIYFYLEMFYNSKRSHAALGYLSPNQFETAYLAQAV